MENKLILEALKHYKEWVYAQTWNVDITNVKEKLDELITTMGKK